VVEAAIPGKSEKKEVEVFGDERFHELLQKFRGGNAHEILAAVSSALNSFYADNPSVDDYTLFIIQKSV
jgi:serine phosphatase RsbU (regulator of sigma subunit)